MPNTAVMESTEVAAMFRSKWEVFFVILLLMIFAAGLGMALYPHVQGAIVDHHIAKEAEEFLDDSSIF